MLIREQHTKDAAHGAILDHKTQIVDQPCLCTVKRTVETGEEQNNVVEVLMSAEGWQSAQVGANRRTQIEYE